MAEKINTPKMDKFLTQRLVTLSLD